MCDRFIERHNFFFFLCVYFDICGERKLYGIDDGYKADGLAVLLSTQTQHKHNSILKTNCHVCNFAIFPKSSNVCCSSSIFFLFLFFASADVESLF